MRAETAFTQRRGGGGHGFGRSFAPDGSRFAGRGAEDIELIGTWTTRSWRCASARRSEWFDALQARIIASFEALERRDDMASGPSRARAPGSFTLSPWERTNHDGAPGGGGRMGLLKGRVFEKAGVHCSAVHGTFAPEFARQIPGAEADPRFWAAGDFADRPSLESRMSRPCT